MNRIKNMKPINRLDLATNYIQLIDELGLKEGYKKSSELAPIMKKNTRSFRVIVEDVLNLYSYGVLDFMIISNCKGYKASNNIDEIDNYLKRKRSQYESLASNYNTLLKAMKVRKNYSIDDIKE